MRHDRESVHRTSRVVTLDDAGRVTERSWELDSGASSRVLYVYGAHGQLVEAVESGRNPDGSQSSFRRIYKYDDRGRLREEQQVRADGSLIRTRQPAYTADGRRIEEQQFPPPARGACRVNSIDVGESGESFRAPATARSGRIIYNVRGAPLEITFKGRLGITVGKVAYETDEAGRTTAVRNYGDTSEFTTHATSLPGAVESVIYWIGYRLLDGWARWNLVRRGEWRTLAHTLIWGPLWFERLTRFDADGRRVEARERFAGGPQTVETWRYDADGRPVEHIGRDHTGSVMYQEEYTYELDAHGNWVRRTMTRPLRPDAPEEMTATTERTIEYFD